MKLEGLEDVLALYFTKRVTCDDADREERQIAVAARLIRSMARRDARVLLANVREGVSEHAHEGIELLSDKIGDGLDVFDVYEHELKGERNADCGS